MKNIDVVKNFMLKRNGGRTANLYVDETATNYQLINYSTIIAVIYDNDVNTVYVNLKYYSNTTRKIQSYIIDEARRKGLKLQLMAHNEIIDNMDYINYKGLVNELFSHKITAVYQYGGYESLQAIDIIHGIDDSLLFIYNNKLYSRIIKYDNCQPYINFNGRCYLRDFLRV